MNYKVGALAVVLSLSLMSNFLIWKVGNDRQRALESELAKLRKLEKRSMVVRGVSKRMEEIAFQQKLVSDDRREKALEQARLAQEMTRVSEQERQRAVKAEHDAQASERVARDAYQTANHQRRVAELQRIVAENSKRMADTLSYISLGHSLGLRAVSLFQAGKTDVARCLAYASYLFTRNYGGDLYNPSVYQGLVQTSQAMISKTLENSTITGLETVPGHDNKLVTVSITGDIYEHEPRSGTISSRCLLSNDAYKFKDLYIAADGTIYALSRTGHLIIVRGGVVSQVAIKGVGNPSFLAAMSGGDELLIVGKGAMATFSLQRRDLTGTHPIAFDVTCVGRLSGNPLLFDRQGRQHVVASLRQVTTTPSPVKGIVTAFTYSTHTGTAVYGTLDGTIYCVDADGRQSQLVGHRSRVTKVKIDYHNLYSSSYDGTLCLWHLTAGKQEPLTLISSSRWLTDFAIDDPRHRIWAATANGNLIEHVISADMMGEMVRKKLTRDLTAEEWRHYVGTGVRQRKLKD